MRYRPSSGVIRSPRRRVHHPARFLLPSSGPHEVSNDLRQGTAPGEFNEPHTLALDSRGRLFVGDRVNQRIQVFDQDGNFLDVWPDIMASGIHITEDDLVFVADYQLENGIVIANAHDFSPVGFIPEALRR